MFDKPYPLRYLGAKPTLVPNPILITQYSFPAVHRRYMVTFETFSFGVTAVKYCGMDERNAKNRFDKIYNDDDAFKVITTCLYAMLDYWKRNPAANLSFYAVPRKFDETILSGKAFSSPKEKRKFIDRYKRVRFAIYDYAMVNLFSPAYFIHMRDTKNAVYLLMNRKQTKPKVVANMFGHFLLDNYDMIFSPDS
ncbi:hypothetical protein SAMN05444008_10925 [Cnuella takakiae]|uniref:Uncharacterized protein n=1 Tax=Cnuella takakiae TaxID=1302690 RepID=A0A1M5CDP6_9BACT|nr:hypothetical protein [Cnuella takakiae]OLY91777.1 hypothetical protein BUE76_07610 [Cnuella takakiae]SHF52868.1 hypothetical protein SAMN05444008_10925 [Cnuella takakiae]